MSVVQGFVGWGGWVPPPPALTIAAMAATSSMASGLYNPLHVRRLRERVRVARAFNFACTVAFPH
jgi:hypothetical protein